MGAGMFGWYRQTLGCTRAEVNGYCANVGGLVTLAAILLFGRSRSNEGRFSVEVTEMTIGSIPYADASSSQGGLAGAEPGQGRVTPLIECAGITKSFGGVRALRGVNLELLPGEVHALLGQNGAGKSTLIKILAGVQQRDGGHIRIDGRDAEIRNPTAARAAGIAVVHQDLSLVPSMSIVGNLFLGREPHGGFGIVRSRQMKREASRFFSDHDLPLDPGTLVQDLPFAYRQLTEIAKALMGNVRILILDEPTSALSAGEEQVLFDAIESVTKAGVGVIYVTHRLSEVFHVAQRVTVFRDGANVATFQTADTDMASLVAAIVGEGRRQRKLMAIVGLGPHGERAAPPDQLEITSDQADRARSAHFTVAAVLHTSGSDWSRQQVSGIVTTLGRYSAALIETVDCRFDPERQVAALDRLIARRPDAIISIPLAGARIAEAHRRVAQAGIKLVLMDNAPAGLIPGTDYVCVVSADNRSLGEIAARTLAPNVPQGGAVGVVGYAVDFFVTNEREAAFREWMAKQRPDVRLKRTEFVDVSEAGHAATSLLETEGDLQGIFVVWDEPAKFVTDAIRATGRAIPITTVDLGNDAALELAAGGLVKGVGAQQPYDQGEAEARAAILALLGHEVPPWVALPAVTVTQLNVIDAYQAVWHAPAPPELIKARRAIRMPVEIAANGQPTPPASIDLSAPPLLDLRGVHNDRLRGVDLVVNSGEVVGLAGMVGCGRTEILETVFGLRPIRSGTMLVDGKPAHFRSPADAIAEGFGLAPEDRNAQGLVIDHSIERNLALPRLGQLTRLGIFRRRASYRRANEAMRGLSVVAPNSDARVGDLSGGNQQKVVFGKWREPRPRLLLLDEPTQGVDVGAREQIYELVRASTGAGSAVLVVCSELAELLLICDRIAFVVDGRIVSQVQRSDVDSEEHLHRMVQELQP